MFFVVEEMERLVANVSNVHKGKVLLVKKDKRVIEEMLNLWLIYGAYFEHNRQNVGACYNFKSILSTSL